MEQPNYFALIPANVRYDKDLSPNAKLLYGEITALSNKNGVCYATNKYFAELYNLSQVSISRLIKSLKDKNYIYIEISYKEGTNEIDKRYIQICNEGINNFDKTPINKNVKGNNTSINKRNIKEKFDKNLFDKFWNAYPRKVSKGSAEKWFEKYRPSEALINEMISKITLLKETEQWKSNNGQYIPYPSTWLNAKGWEDEVLCIQNANESKYDTETIFEDSFGKYKLTKNGDRIFL